MIKGTILCIMHPTTLGTLVLPYSALCGVVATLSTPSAATTHIHHGVLIGLLTESIALHGSVIETTNVTVKVNRYTWSETWQCSVMLCDLVSNLSLTSSSLVLTCCFLLFSFSLSFASLSFYSSSSSSALSLSVSSQYG